MQIIIKYPIELESAKDTLKKVVSFRESDTVLLPKLTPSLSTDDFDILSSDSGAMYVHIPRTNQLYRALSNVEDRALRFMSVINNEPHNIITV